MCLFPGKAKLNPEGGRPLFHVDGDLKLPCGKCDECLKQRASGWGMRAQHELSLHKKNCFLTLTYDDEHLIKPVDIKKPFQDFMKRLRKKTKQKLNYMVSHEYGSQTYRPHHHAIIFGYSPDSQSYLRKSPSGNPLFISPELDKLWGNGFHSIGEANPKTAYYIAAYALKGKKHEFTDSTTGECITLNDSFDCSKRPGIGLTYFSLHYRQLVNNGVVLPRYYANILKESYESEKIIYSDDLSDRKKCIYKIQQEHPEIYEEYENNLFSNFTIRTPQQIIAKLDISNAKKSLGDSEFRSAPDSQYHLKLSKALKYQNNQFLLGSK